MKNTLLICLTCFLQVTIYGQDFCEEAICISDNEIFNGVLNRTNLDFQACDNSYISYEAVHVFSSFESGTATILFLEEHFAGYDVMILDSCDPASANCVFVEFSQPDLPNGVDFAVESNTTYYIIVAETVSGAGGTLEYTLQVDLPGQNNECTNLCSAAIPLEDGIQYLGILEDNSLQFNACGYNYNSYAAVHTFESIENESVSLSFSEAWFGSFDIILLEGCNQNSLNCVFSTFAGQDVVNGIDIEIESNTTYYILIAEVATGGSGELDYTIQIDFGNGNNSNCLSWLNEKIESELSQYCPTIVCTAIPSDYYYKVFETLDDLIIIEKFECQNGVIQFYYKNGDLSFTCDLSYINDVITPDCFLNDYPFELNNDLLFTCESSLPPNIELDVVGMPCDDGDSNTENDVIQEDCSCLGDIMNNTEDHNNISITIYPNPTNSLVHLDIPTISEIQGISIFNSSGQPVLQQKEIIENKIDISTFPLGSYFISMMDSKGDIYFSKFIKY
jgi:hypothetical protein